MAPALLLVAGLLLRHEAKSDLARSFVDQRALAAAWAERQVRTPGPLALGPNVLVNGSLVLGVAVSGNREVLFLNDSGRSLFQRTSIDLGLPLLWMRRRLFAGVGPCFEYQTSVVGFSTAGAVRVTGGMQALLGGRY